MTGIVSLFPFAAADGPTNMAEDEVLLDAAADRGVAALRFYTWAEPTLSLGYFQPSAAVEVLGRPLPWVRRSTGGAAIVHHRELTYALALPAGKPWHAGDSWICRFHRLLRDILVESGLESHVVGCGEERKLGDVLCFLHQTPGDLLVDGSKVAGSAQRKRRGALLQHGSLLLERSEHAPTLSGINDAAGKPLYTPQSLSELLIRRFESETGWTAIPTRWSRGMEAQRDVIRAERYGNDEWNRKR